jgi:hypothetical protein
MTNQQRILAAILFVVAVIGGGWLAINVTPSPARSGEASPSVPASPSQAPASPGPSASPTATPAPTATPQPSAPATLPATIVLTGLKLDAADDPNGVDRKVTFKTQGPGTIAVGLTLPTPQGGVVICFGTAGGSPECRTTAKGTRFTATTSPATYELTLRGDGMSTPAVEVAVSFPATAPSVTINNARFDGKAFPDTNGLQATVTPRQDGDVTLEAEWGGHPLLYDIELTEQAGGSGALSLTNQGPATRVTQRMPVTGTNPWMLVLRNSEDGFGITPLDATIAWP